jgi:hypothetical protein
MEELKSCFKVKESQRELYGFLYLTDYKIKFVQDRAKAEDDNGLFDIPYGYVFNYD